MTQEDGADERALDDERLDGIVDEILLMQRSGLQPSVEHFVGLYPELEDDLRELIPALNLAERLRTTQYSTLQTSNSSSKWLHFHSHGADRFQILRPLDRGGLGIVSVALDQDLHREVAVKEIRPDRADDHGLRSKFILEAEVTGGLEHPGIVPVYALGASPDGRPYYAMRLIRGDNLREHIRKFHGGVQSGKIAFDGPQLRHLIRRFLVVCEAIDYAHSRGVLHRDLKPSNVMLGRYGETLVVDWGLAKATGLSGPDLDNSDADPQRGLDVQVNQETPMMPSLSDDATRFGSSIGTPGYAPPEQILGQLGKIGVRSDVYGLGAILYEILTNVPPCTGTLAEITQQVTTVGIVNCRSVFPQVPKPIDAICSKALSMDYDHRYASAGLLRADIERWLDDESVSSYAEPFYSRLRRWLKNHQALSTAMLAIGLMTILGSFLIAIVVGQNNSKLRALNSALDKTNSELIESNHREMMSRTEAESRERAERWERYRTNISATISSQQVDNRSLMKSSLESAPEEYRNWEWRHLQSQLQELSVTFGSGSQICPKTLQQAIVQNANEVSLRDPASTGTARVLKHDVPISFVRFGPDAKYLAVVLKDNRTLIWDLAAQKIIASNQASGQVSDLLFHPSRPLLLIGIRQEGRFYAWNFSDGGWVDSDSKWGNPDTEYFRDFNASGDRFLINKADKFSLIDVSKREVVVELDGVGLGFSPSGNKFLAVHQNKFQVRDSTSGAMLLESRVMGESLRYWKGDWSQDENRVLIGGRFPFVTLQNWDLSTAAISELEGHTNGIWNVRISPDGKTGLSVSQDSTARVWDLESSKEKFVLRGHRAPVRAGNFRHDGKRIITSGDELSSRVWDSETGKLITTLQRPASARELYYSDDDSAILCRDELINDYTQSSIWRSNVIEHNGILRGHSNYVYDATFSKDGTRIASAAWDGTIRLWDTKTQQCTNVFAPSSVEPIGFRSVQFSPDGNFLVASGIAGGSGEVFLWDLQSNKLSQQWSCLADTEDFRAAFDSSGEMVLAGSTDGTVRSFDVATGSQNNAFAGHVAGEYRSRYSETCSEVVSHPDSQRWFSAGYDGNVLIWEKQSGRQLAKMTGHRGAIYRIDLSKDGVTVATAGLDGQVKLWDANTYQLIATLGHGSPVYSVSFHPDGSRLAAGSSDGLIRIWDIATHSQVAELHGHSDYVHSVDFSPDGTQLVSGSGDFSVRIWDTISPIDRKQ